MVRTPRDLLMGGQRRKQTLRRGSQREGHLLDALYWKGRLRNTLGLSWGGRQAFKKRLFPFLRGH